MDMEEEEGVVAGEMVEDIGASVISRYQKSGAPEHQQLRAVVSAIREVLKEQGLPLTVTTYFGATMCPLEQQCDADAVEGPDTTAFCTFLATVLPKLSRSVLQSQSAKSMGVLVKLLSSRKAPPNTIKAALSCLQHVVCAADKSNWISLAPSFACVLRCTLHQAPKVRKRAQQCLAELLSSFQGSPALEKASDTTVSSCQQCVSAFGISAGSLKRNKMQSDEVPNAVVVLYMLGTLKMALPLLPAKGVSKVLSILLDLFQLKQPLITRHVLDALLALFLRLREDLPLTEAGNVLAAATSLLSATNKNVDEILTAVRVLQHGLLNINAVEEGVTSTVLPASFHAITELFSSEQEEVSFGAAESLRNLVASCINDSMIHQGLSRISSHANYVTSIERICASAESTLSYQYSGNWDKALRVISALFERLGSASYSLMAGTVRALAELEHLSDEDMPVRKQLHETLGTAVAAMGPDQFLKLLPLNMDDKDLTRALVWLIPILKQHIIGAKLSYFAQEILPLSSRLEERARNHSASGKAAAARNAEACAQSLWALLPAFCNYPIDVKESFRLVAKPLGDALQRDAELRGLISFSLQILVRQNKAAVGGIQSGDVNPKFAYTESVASENLSAIAAFSKNFLPVLFNLFCAASPEKRGDLQAAIGALTSISTEHNAATVRKLFKDVSKKLLEATKDADAKERRCMLMDLALSLISGLDEQGLKALYAVAKPAVQDKDAGVQKKGYKILAAICKEHENFVTTRAKEILEVLQTGMAHCQPSAKQYRMACLQALALSLVKAGEIDFAQDLLKEAILGLKEINKRTREAAYDFLIGIGKGLLETDESGQKLVRFFQMVVGCTAVRGVAGEPHAISAAISGVSRLVYEFSRELEHEVEKYLTSAFYLLRNYKSREVIKSLLGLMKVLVARLPVEGVLVHLRDMVQSMMVWADDSKNRFRAKVRDILEKLIRRCGFDAVLAVMPAQHAKHLTNIRKVKERAEKKKRSASEADEQASQRSRATTAKHSQWSHTAFFSDGGADSDDEDDDDDTQAHTTTAKAKSSSMRSRKVPKSKKRLPEDVTGGYEGGEPLNLLDVPSTRAALSAPKREKQARGDSDEEMRFDDEGRLIVEERRRKRQREEEEEDEEDVRSHKQRGSSIAGSRSSKQQQQQSKRAAGSWKQQNKRARKSGATSWAYKGEEYSGGRRSGGGDVKREGKVEPYAYWPLDPKMLNRRQEKKAAARKGLQSVFRATKKLEGSSVKQALAAHASILKKRHKKK